MCCPQQTVSEGQKIPTWLQVPEPVCLRNWLFYHCLSFLLHTSHFFTSFLHPSPYSCVLCIIQCWSISIFLCQINMLSTVSMSVGACDFQICKIHVSGSYSPTHMYPCAYAHTRTRVARNSCSIFEWLQSQSMSNQCPSFSLPTAVWKTEHTVAGWKSKSHWQRNIQCILITFLIWSHIIYNGNNPNQRLCYVLIPGLVVS